MTDSGPPAAPRVLVATVTASRARATEEAVKAATEELTAASCRIVRSVVVRGESQYIRQLVHHVASDNEADALVMVGGVGIGPRDLTCDTLDSFFERHIEGFGDAYRQLLRDEFKTITAILARASAGVYNGCLVFALPSHAPSVRRAVQTLVAPVLVEGVAIASGVHAAVSIPPRSSAPP